MSSLRVSANDVLRLPFVITLDGEPTDADSLPSATLYHISTAGTRTSLGSATVATDSDAGTGGYVVTPAIPSGAVVTDRYCVLVSATVSTIDRKLWIDCGQVDATVDSRLAPTTAGRTLGVDASGKTPATIASGDLATDAITATSIEDAAANKLADALLKRDWTSIAGSIPWFSVFNALRWLRNGFRQGTGDNAGKIEIPDEVGDVAWTGTPTTDENGVITEFSADDEPV